MSASEAHSEAPARDQPRRRHTGGATPASTDPGARTARLVAVANQKGGVGKSTTAVSLGATLAEMGHQVLVIDLDPQGNASTGLGIRHEARDVTIYDVLVSEADITKAVVATPVPRLFAIPSTIDLAGAEIELVSQFSRELRLRRALDPLREGVFDFILFDCPPSLGLLTINALAAAEELLVPIQCEYYALEGLGQLLRNVRLVQQNVNPGLRLSGIAMTMFDPRTKLSEQVVEEVRKYFGDLVYESIIPRTVRLSEAPGFGQPITVYDPRSRGAESYRDLAREVSARPAPEGPMPVFDELPSVVVKPIAPPSEPVARAPRPLRESVAEDHAQAEADVDVDGGDAESGAGHAGSAVAVVEPPDDVPPSPDEPQVETTAEGSSSDGVGGTREQQPDRDVEASGAPTDSVRPSAPSEGAIEARTSGTAVGSADAPEPSEDAPEPSDAPSPRREVEEPTAVVIDAYDLDPDARPEPGVPQNGPMDEDDGQRKRWSLFRRGGRR